jgi:3-oxoacyl-[acyl-carrier protein] reductase
MKTVLVTNATQYTGLGAVEALCAAGHRVVCHDQVFSDDDALRAFQAMHPQAVALRRSDVPGLVTELGSIVGTLDAVVSNDVYPLTKALVEDVSLDDLRGTFEALLVFPFRLAQLLLPDMKSRRNGCFVFVTSARQLRPEPGFSVPTSIRAGTAAFAQALSKEVASYGIQVNVVAPNYLYSEMYYPRARFIDTEEGRQQIASIVPAGRLGTPEEVGELIAFLVSGRSRFITGQVVYFTGGWP